MLESIGYKMISSGSPIWLYRVEVAAEEFLEMLGASLILYAVLLLCCLARNKPGFHAAAAVQVVGHAATLEDLRVRVNNSVKTPN